MDALASSLERSPELFPHALDVRNDTVSLVRLTRADYERASFLDGRILGPYTLTRTVPWRQLAAAIAAGKLDERCHFIFHIGHVGSTLLSRLLGSHKGLFALREPAVLRTLALMDGGSDPQPPQPWNESEFEARLSAFIKLWSRTFDPADTATIKATSFVSEIAPQLLNRACQPKALLVYVKPEAYLATILGGPNAREEAKSLTLARLARLHRRLGREAWRLASFSEGEGLAMSWLAEMSALASAHAAAGSRAHLLDFDAFLADPRERLLTAFRFFDVDATRGAIADILAGPLMRTYSKAPEHAYSPQLRADILDEARKTHAVEIAKGLAWLDQAAAEFPLVRDCLALAER